MSNVACSIDEYLTSADVARIAVEHCVPITPAGVRVAANTGRLRTAASTPRGIRLFQRSDVDAFIQATAARRRQPSALQPHKELTTLPLVRLKSAGSMDGPMACRFNDEVVFSDQEEHATAKAMKRGAGNGRR